MIGFEMIESLIPSEEEAKEGFDRPIMIFKKIQKWLISLNPILK